MQKKILLTLFVLLLGINIVKSQTADKLAVGDAAPNLVLPTTDNAIQSFSFPYKNKMVLLFFWSSSVNKSKENLFKYSRIHSRYASSEYKSCDGFDMISVALQSDKNSWVADLKKYNLTELNNCIAQKGYQDMFVKPYKLTETPTSFLIDETGKIVFVNPDIRTLINYLDERRNTILSDVVQTAISIKVLFGKESLQPLKNEQLIFVGMRGDTARKVSTNENGAVLIDNFNTQANYFLNILPTTQVQDDDRIYLASEAGQIISEIFRADKGYQYKLIDVDMPFLRQLRVVNKVKSAESNGLDFSDNLFKKGGVVLSKDASAKLNEVANTLKKNPKAKLEIITHTDCKGEKTVNEATSLKQSQAILNYLVSKGVAKTRLKASGKGEAQPLNHCTDGVSCTEKELEQNRRTEFKFSLN